MFWFFDAFHGNSDFKMQNSFTFFFYLFVMKFYLDVKVTEKCKIMRISAAVFLFESSLMEFPFEACWNAQLCVLTRFWTMTIWKVHFYSYVLLFLHLRPICLGWQAIFLSKMAPGEVGVWLPWWCSALVLPAPGSWGDFLNLIIFS